MSYATLNLRTLAWFATLLLFTAVQPAASQQSQISPPAETTDGEYKENWNSHIDNQAYLEQRRRQRDRTMTTPPVIIIERYTEQGYSPRRDCYHGDCSDSWEMEYHDQNSSVIYRERYSPNRYSPVYTRPGPHHRKTPYRSAP